MRRAISVLLLATLGTAFGAINEPVKVQQGSLTGTAGVLPEVRVFKGVPFAGPPVGDLRWRAPKEAAKWEGVRAADKFSPVCMQRRGTGSAAASEDCLYLNIYTAAKSAGD